MALPLTFIGINSQNAGTVCLYPAASQSGDLIVIILNSCIGAMQTPAGFTQVGATYQSPTFSYDYGVFRRIRGAETQVNYFTDQGGAKILAFRNASSIGALGTWVEAPAVPGSPGATATISLSSITPQNAASIVIGYVSHRQSPIAATPTSAQSAGWTMRNTTAYTLFAESAATKEYGSTSPTGLALFTIVKTTGTDYPSVGVQIEVLP